MPTLLRKNACCVQLFFRFSYLCPAFRQLPFCKFILSAKKIVIRRKIQSRHLSTSCRKSNFVRMKRLFPLLACCCWVVLFFASCRKSPPAVPRPAPSVYYWRTVLTFSPEERAFLRRHHIGKVYLRYFDVAPDQITDEPVPVATLQCAACVAP